MRRAVYLDHEEAPLPAAHGSDGQAPHRHQEQVGRVRREGIADEVPDVPEADKSRDGLPQQATLLAIPFVEAYLYPKVNPVRGLAA
jgi:hypothetical protein